MNILLVDDSRPLLLTHENYILHIFRNNNVKIDLAYCGNDARDLIQDKKYDLVITDMMMPNGNGLKVIDKCKETNTKFIIISGHCEGYGIPSNNYPYLEKPVTKNNLEEAIFTNLNLDS